MDVQIEASWKKKLSSELEQAYFREIVHFLKDEKRVGHAVYPPGPLIFNAFNSAPFDRVKVVIIGQDPYHNPGQAHGLSFSVAKGVPPPPSLMNIFKELEADLQIPIPKHGSLEAWAAQGVLLLNAALTVTAHQPMSHSQIGWHHFTDHVVQIVSAQKEHLVFMLWGKFAQGKKSLVDHRKHLILTAPHPSPFSAHSGFFGCRHFSQCNDWLKQQGETPINWQL